MNSKLKNALAKLGLISACVGFVFSALIGYLDAANDPHFGLYDDWYFSFFVLLVVMFIFASVTLFIVGLPIVYAFNYKSKVK